MKVLKVFFVYLVCVLLYGNKCFAEPICGNDCVEKNIYARDKNGKCNPNIPFFVEQESCSMRNADKVLYDLKNKWYDYTIRNEEAIYGDTTEEHCYVLFGAWDYLKYDKEKKGFKVATTRSQNDFFVKPAFAFEEYSQEMSCEKAYEVLEVMYYNAFDIMATSNVLNYNCYVIDADNPKNIAYDENYCKELKQLCFELSKQVSGKEEGDADVNRYCNNFKGGKISDYKPTGKYDITKEIDNNITTYEIPKRTLSIIGTTK